MKVVADSKNGEVVVTMSPRDALLLARCIGHAVPPSDLAQRDAEVIERTAIDLIIGEVRRG